MSLAEVFASWRDRAACKDMPLFDVMNEEDGNSNPHKVRAAKKICAICPVRADCLEWACTTPKPLVGHVAGGLSPSELRLARKQPGFAEMRRRLARPRCGTHGGYVSHQQAGEQACDACKAAATRYRHPRVGAVAW